MSDEVQIIRKVKSKKADGINKPMELNNSFLQKNSNGSFFYWLLLPTMFGTSLFSIGCMKRQYAVILESICERDLISIRFPVYGTGLLTAVLTCFTLLSFSLLLGQIILRPTPFLSFAFWTNFF